MVELARRGIAAEAQVPIELAYKGVSVGEFFADIVVEGAIVVELKAVAALGPIHVAQVLSYLRATKLRLGLLINFNVALLHAGVKRIVL